MSAWPRERVVVIGDDPYAVEATVNQLEAWGAQPAVMFERERALRALQVQEPDLVVIDFGRSPAEAGSVLGTLEAVSPILPGALHPAPVVALASGSLAGRLEHDAWAPIHVVPHDDPAQVREALLAALQEATAPAAVAAPVAAASPATLAGSPAASTAAASPTVAAPTAAASPAAVTRARLLGAVGGVLAVAVVGAYVVQRVLEATSQSAPPPQVPTSTAAAPTTVPRTSTPAPAPSSTPPAPSGAPAALATVPATVPTSAAQSVATSTSAPVPTSSPVPAPTGTVTPAPTSVTLPLPATSLAPSATATGTAAATAPRMPVTGSR